MNLKILLYNFSFSHLWFTNLKWLVSQFPCSSIMSFILIPSNFHRGRFKLYRLISRIVSAWTRIYKWLCWLKFFCWEPNCWVFIFLLLIKICKVFKNTFFLIVWRQWIDCNPYWLLLYDFIFNFIKSRSRYFINFCLYKLFLLCEYYSFGVY